MIRLTRRLRAVGLLAVALLATSLSQAVGATAPSHEGQTIRLKHVFVIVLENHARDQVINDPNTPFISSVANRYGVASMYYGVTHPSLPNYVAMIAGNNFGVNNDDPNNRFGARNLADQLEAHGMTWATYQESMPSVGYLGDYFPNSTDKLYASKHNPFVLMNDIRNNAARLKNVKPYRMFASDLRSNNVPNFSMIVPNQCHDMHGGVYGSVGGGSPCPYNDVNNDPADVYLKHQADAFVRTAVRRIMHSDAWDENAAIFIVADESDFLSTSQFGWADTSGCCDTPVLPAGSPLPDTSALWTGGPYGGGLSPAIVITDEGPRHFVSDTPYNHYSLLTTLEQNWHLGYLGHAGDTAGGVVAMNDLLKQD
jgi:phosphatidylinositol-3-phosphatase